MGKESDEVGGVEISSVGGDAEGSLEDRVAGLLRSSKERATKGIHHSHYKTLKKTVKKADGDSEKEVEASSLPPEDSSMYQSFTSAGALEPPYSPDLLLELYRLSNSLRQNIDAYATNIDGFGYTLEPVVDLDSDDAWELAADELRATMEEAGADVPELDTEWDGLVQARVDRLKKEASKEKVRLKNFWDFCGLDISFVQLRKRTRADLEIHGYGGWEVLRNKAGDISKFVHVPAHTFRILPADEEPRSVTEVQRRGPFDVEEVIIHRYFYRYVHWQGGDRNVGRTVFLKEWGDDRVVSRTTGEYYETPEALKLEEGEKAQEAHEFLYFDLHNPDSAYGENRWMGNLLSVLGSRESEEVNYLYFKNKSIPPMVLLISGGRMVKEDKEKLKDYVERELKGSTGSFHRIMIITARSDKSSGEVPRLEFKPLTEALLNEGIFQKYDERNIDKVGSAFRQSRLMRGDVRDFNRATADATLRFTEAQVYSGERMDFDFVMNRKVMTLLEARYWVLRSNPPPLQDPEAVVEMVERLAKASVITPAEGRRLLAKVGIVLDVIDEPWTRRPAAFTLSGIGFTPEEGERLPQGPQTVQGSDDGEAVALREIEKTMYQNASITNIPTEALLRMNREDLAEKIQDMGIADTDTVDLFLDILGK